MADALYVSNIHINNFVTLMELLFDVELRLTVDDGDCHHGVSNGGSSGELWQCSWYFEWGMLCGHNIFMVGV